MNTHTLWFCPLMRKLQAFEILKLTQGSQWRTSNFTHEIQLFKIYITFNQYFRAVFFHYFVYNEVLYSQPSL